MTETELKNKMDELGKKIHEYEEKQLAFDLENQELAKEIATLKD